MPTFLKDLRKIKRPDLRIIDGFPAFLGHPKIAALGWSDDVVRQWLWDHPDHFLTDYGKVDLERIGWRLELVPAAEFDNIPTGASEPDTIEGYADDHRRSLDLRRHLPEIVEAWEEEGRWLVPPVLISRAFIEPGASGLQVVEGRTRVGILRGRRRDGLLVAEQHLAWVGRRRDEAAI